MAQKEAKVEGVIYALPEEIALNILERNKKIFVKYLPHEPTRKTEVRLEKGKKLYIYASGLNKSVIGEVKIKNVEYLSMNEILNKHKKNLMISESELRLYAEGREQKKAQVLELENPVLYPMEMKVSVPITMQGTYVTNKNKKVIFGKKNERANKT